MGNKNELIFNFCDKGIRQLEVFALPYDSLCCLVIMPIVLSCTPLLKEAL